MAPSFTGSLQPQPFKVAVADEAIQEFKTLLKLSKIGPETYENSTGASPAYGVSRKWISETKDYWLNTYDWRKIESRINEFENFKTEITGDDGAKVDLHFIALRSEKPDAVPVVLLHGWPGSPLEFVGLLAAAREKYQPDQLPYTFVVPSLPGYAFSSSPSPLKQSTCESVADVIDKLMVGLGYGNGYVAQGGDIGCFVARILASKHSACKAAHLNFGLMPPPEGVSQSDISAAELQGLGRAGAFQAQGDAYAREHGTRPATIGLLLSTSPLALLVWISEKFLDWTDQDPSKDQILDSVTLYWLTETFPRAIYPYRQFFGPDAGNDKPIPLKYYVDKPLGYSWFPKELAPIPKAWVATTGNLVWHKEHTSGGHFAAMEKPKELLEDIEDFVSKALK